MNVNWLKQPLATKHTVTTQLEGAAQIVQVVCLSPDNSTSVLSSASFLRSTYF